MTERETRMRKALERALPLLIQLGDYIGNGPDNERCETIGAVRAALAMTPAQKLGKADGRIFTQELPREDWVKALTPGQRGADEGLINALGFEEVARLFEVAPRSPEFRDACEEYNRAFDAAVAEALTPEKP